MQGTETMAQPNISNKGAKAMRPPPVIKSKGGKRQLPIDEQYEKWARFENFLKFAEKKEVRDRLKELDPPPLSNYVDPSTID